MFLSILGFLPCPDTCDAITAGDDFLTNPQKQYYVNIFPIEFLDKIKLKAEAASFMRASGAGGLYRATLCERMFIREVLI
jgi:hypothetical protein